jgi:hypothetical protein
MPPKLFNVTPTPKKSLPGTRKVTGSDSTTTATPKKSHRGKRKATIFGKHLNDESTSKEDVHYKCRAKFIPPSPPRQDIRSLRHSSRRPDCTLFGPFRAMVYTGYFFCQNCQFYKDALTSGTCSKI